MTPSEERKFKKEIKDLIDANAEMDTRQENKLKALSSRVAKLESVIKKLVKE